MLPNISLNSPTNSQDVGKQLSTIRSQMASLKEAIEDELHSISYDQLDAALRARIDKLNDLYGAAIEQSNIVAETLQAKYIVADEIAAKYATVVELGAAVARIGKIEANYISTDVLDVSTLITTANLSAQKIAAKQIDVSTGKITAAQIDASNLQVKGANIDSSAIQDLNATDGYINDLSCGVFSVNRAISIYDNNVDMKGTTVDISPSGDLTIAGRKVMWSQISGKWHLIAQ